MSTVQTMSTADAKNATYPNRRNNIIPVFYNLFIKTPGAKSNVLNNIVKEQMANLLPRHKFLVVSIGAKVTTDDLQTLTTMTEETRNAPIVLQH